MSYRQNNHKNELSDSENLFSIMFCANFFVLVNTSSSSGVVKLKGVGIEAKNSIFIYYVLILILVNISFPVELMGLLGRGWKQNYLRKGFSYPTYPLVNILSVEIGVG